MAGLKKIDGYEEYVVNICPNDTDGDIVEIANIFIQLPKKPRKKDILYSDLPQKEQRWKRFDIPKELMSIKDMDDWANQPRHFREKYTPLIEDEFKRRNEGVWFMNNGIPTYLPKSHYMFLQWAVIDGEYPHYYAFQRTLEIHWEACKHDPRSYGQAYTKTRRTGFTELSSSDMVDDSTIKKNSKFGIMSKTGKDAQDNVFSGKVVRILRHYPFFFKPIMEGSTNPKSEISFREPASRLTKKNKAITRTEALNTVLDWRNTTNNAYDGEKLYRLFIDEYHKFENPLDINTIWRIHKTCLQRGRRIIGKARLGSTVNPMKKGGANGKKLWQSSDPRERDANGRTKSGLYRIFIASYESLEGFFDIYGNPIIDDPKEPMMTIDGEFVDIGAKTYLLNERKGLEKDHEELNERIRQFPFDEDEAFRDSIKSSAFNLIKIYQQKAFNESINRDIVFRGNFSWDNGKKDTKVIWKPDEKGKFRITWLPNIEDRNAQIFKGSRRFPANSDMGRGGVDSYDIDETVDSRSSNGSFHLYNLSNLKGAPSNQFVLEYIERPPYAAIFYEDVLMAAVFYGYPLLIENNKYGIVRHFEARGYQGYVLKRPKEYTPEGSKGVKQYGIPSNSVDTIQTHGQKIETYIHYHVGEWGEHDEEEAINNGGSGFRDVGENGVMYFDRTLNDWAEYDMKNRTKYDATISSGLALMAADVHIKSPTEKYVFKGDKQTLVRTYKKSQRKW